MSWADLFAVRTIVPTTDTWSSSVTVNVDYKCGKCGKRYRRLGSQFSCCVIHQPNECCHAFEQRITKKGYPKERNR